MTEAAPLVDGRSCEGCTLCCKLLRIRELDKPPGVWCQHCSIGVGCTIYDQRPSACERFFCAYRLSPELDEHWRPAASQIMVRFDERRISVFVDAANARAWRQEPFYSEIKHWAAQAIAHRGQVIVWEGRDLLAIFPDREKPLGQLEAHQVIVNVYPQGQSGQTYDIIIINAGDPRLTLQREP